VTSGFKLSERAYWIQKESNQSQNAVVRVERIGKNHSLKMHCIGVLLWVPFGKMAWEDNLRIFIQFLEHRTCKPAILLLGRHPVDVLILTVIQYSLVSIMHDKKPPTPPSIYQTAQP
jgi:hypothetical protein